MKETPESVPDATTTEYTNFYNYLKNQLIPQVSRYIDNYTSRFFIPEYTTENYYNRNLLDCYSLENYGYYFDRSNYRLYTGKDLLEIITFSSSGTALSSAETRIVGTPGYAIDIDRDSDFEIDTDTFSKAQAVTGWFGYNIDWSNAFDTIETITITDSATSITVADSTIYKRLQYVRCEDELMLITAIPDATTLTVNRGIRGTTSAAHTSKDLKVYIIDESLHIAATRMCSWLYMNRVHQGNVVQITNTSVVLDRMPTMVKDNLDRLEKRGAV
jgi:hypothetical protein